RGELLQCGHRGKRHPKRIRAKVDYVIAFKDAPPCCCSNTHQGGPRVFVGVGSRAASHGNSGSASEPIDLTNETKTRNRSNELLGESSDVGGGGGSDRSGLLPKQENAVSLEDVLYLIAGLCNLNESEQKTVHLQDVSVCVYLGSQNGTKWIGDLDRYRRGRRDIAFNDHIRNGRGEVGIERSGVDSDIADSEIAESLCRRRTGCDVRIVGADGSDWRRSDSNRVSLRTTSEYRRRSVTTEGGI